MLLLFSQLLDALLPRRCCGCKAYDTWLCNTCVRAALHVSHVRTEDTWQAYCGISVVTTLGAYGNPIWRDAVQQLKFKKIRGVADVFGGELAHAISEFSYAPGDTVIVPVPLHAKRLKERGFNQSLLIAQALQRAIGGTVLNAAVIRTAHSTSQTTFSHQERLQRMKGIFGPGRDAHLLAGKRVILVDDVITTGATVAEVGKTIALHHPATIHVAAVAHGS